MSLKVFYSCKVMAKSRINLRDFRNLEVVEKKSFFSLLKSNLVNLFPSPESRKFFKKNNKKTPKKRQHNWEKPLEKSEKKKVSLKSRALSFGVFFMRVPLFLVYPFFKVLKFLVNSIKVFVNRENVVGAVFILCFVTIIFHFASLQVFSGSRRSNNKDNVLANSLQIILSQKGQIYIRDLTQSQADGNNYIPVTATQNVANLFFNPRKLQEYVKDGLVIEKVVEMISSNLNLSYNEVLKTIKDETLKENPKQYVSIEKFINENQKAVVEGLRKVPEYRKLVIASGLGIEEKQVRSYPEGKLLAATIGYVPKFQVTREEALRTGCKSMVLANEDRKTYQSFVPGDSSKAEYNIGYYGLEQKYCSELTGLNGRKVLNNELNSDKVEESRVVNGASIYTTIDRNLQRKAEQVLEEGMKRNTNSNGIPKDGTVIVMEAKTGKILAMASNPTFDPNVFNEANPESFRNVATSVDYEVGSVMKPLTVAAALNEFQSGNIGSKGQKLGVAPDFQFEDFNKKGKVYQDNSGNKFTIQNSEGKSYESLGKIGLDKCLVYSINTCISNVVDTLGTRKLQEYFSEKFLFGKPTAINLPGDSHGNVSNLAGEINCLFCYAQHGFGQGISNSPIQLMRAYTAIANSGVMVDPYLVEKIKYADGYEDNGSSSDSSIKRNAPQQIFRESASRLVSDYMTKVIQETRPGVGANRAKVEGYNIAGKTGTAQINRPFNGKPCNYDCNTNKGLYDHTFIGFNVNAKNPIIIMVKISEPLPGQKKNFSGDTVGQSFADMMKYTLDYLGIPKDG